MNFQDHYKKDVIPEMKKKFGYMNDLAVPKILKTVLNVGLGKTMREEKTREHVDRTLKAITGQKPIFTRAKKSIAGFNIRTGTILGAQVTLRGKRMYDFLSKLIGIAIPRVRDFQGLPPTILDRKGNCTIGLKEYFIFPEAQLEDASLTHGLEITIRTSAKIDSEALELLRLMKFPFKT
ncbi:MAG: 50S ribosomal protein L5 [Candidatus Jacksonbacteria bacterium RIFCSPHIGHO2_12_FULL_44_12]|nr:MAG: 50S ribosomal protein L5 [Candidatus Jacksonbacteria bacterium RIFCSPHIGHO2_12_FULL_44_12]